MLFPDIYVEKTKNKACSRLERYRILKNIADEQYSPKITATYSFEPKANQTGPNRQTEIMVTRKVDAELELEEIRKAINRITDIHARRVIIEKYCRLPLLDKEIYPALGYSESEFYRLHEKGVLLFAECYRNGILLVFKNESEFFGRNLQEVYK